MLRLTKDTSNIKATVKRPYYFFQCDCGEIVSRRSDCGALHCSLPSCSISTHNKHGESHTRLFNIWSGMRDRCLGNHKSSITYKHNGIGIDPVWDLFINFASWANDSGYRDDLTIDRIDITKGYSPTNCEWVSRAENTRRQVRDLHGNHIAVKITNEVYEKIFGSINLCAEFIILSGASKSTNIKSVATHISGILSGSRKAKNNKAYGFYIAEAK